MKYNLTFDNIRKNGDLLFESVRGSHLFGLNTEKSDMDTFGLYCCQEDYLFDSGSSYQGVIFSEHNDDSWYELRKFVEGLGKSNPNYLEAIFTPPQWILYYDPILDPLWNIRDTLLTKASFKSFGSYAVSQIKKAKGLNKAINTNPDEVKTRKGVLDYCLVPSGQGTKRVLDWLKEHGLKQKYCGLILLPGMHDTYGLYYDLGTHVICEYGCDLKNFTNIKETADKLRADIQNIAKTDIIEKLLESTQDKFIEDRLYKLVPYGFSGIVNENSDSNEPRICSVPKNQDPLTILNYNRSGYESHCKDYKRYWDWVRNRNQERYELNKGHDYDAKNMSACIRIMTEAVEIAEGKGLRLDRTNIDRDFLLSIKNHQKSYEEVLGYATNLEERMTKAFESSNLPDEPDLNLLDDVLIEIRKKHYSKNLNIG